MRYRMRYFDIGMPVWISIMKPFRCGAEAATPVTVGMERVRMALCWVLYWEHPIRSQFVN